MSQTNIYLSDETEIRLKELKKLAVNNGLSHSKAGLLSMAVEIATNAVEKLDDNTFQQVTNLKK